MISIEQHPDDGIFVVSPDGPISSSDIAELNRQVSDYINANDRVPNLVLRAEHFPAWKDFDAVSDHIRFVRDHHKLVRKVAIVTDSRLVWLVRPLIDSFTGAKIRRFTAGDYEKAYSWARTEEDDIGKFEPIEGLPGDVVAFSTIGTITAQDYREVFEPAVDEKLKQHDKLKCLLVAGPELDGFSAGAIWDDARFGLSHFTTFSKIALVTDIDWLRTAAKMFGSLMPADLMVFGCDEIDDAKEWIKK